jgi:hypothetical protein
MVNVVIELGNEPVQTVMVENHLVVWWVDRFNLLSRSQGSHFIARQKSIVMPSLPPEDVLKALNVAAA